MTSIQTLLPLLSNALLLGCIPLMLSHRWLAKPVHRFALTFSSFVLALVPFSDLSLAHYFAGLFGNLSVTSIVLLCTYIYHRAKRTSPRPASESDLNYLYLIIGISAIFLYPSALGLIQWDLYAQGFYPIILAPAMLAIFILCIYRNSFFLPALLSVVFLSYATSLFESDNLWDYLLDPLVAFYCLARLPGAIANLYGHINRSTLEAAGISIAASFLLFSVFLSRINHDAFRYQLVAEDGFTETLTVLSLLLVTVICIYRLVKLRHHRALIFLGMTGFIGLAGLFGAGEEISWGQRIFEWQTPDYFLKHNKQDETGLHNLVVEIDGEKISINKVIFGTGLALAMLIYLFVMTPFYRQDRVRGGPFAELIHKMAIPMPKNYQAIGYLVIVACVELLIDSSKRGEMTEFAGSIIFLLNVAFPDNHEIFDIDFDRPVS